MIELLLQAERALTVGMLDQAEALYWQVVESDPRNSIAVVGLARVAWERGDERTALELGRRALSIDPENVAAIRLTQRLTEVIATRGETVPGDEEATTEAEGVTEREAATEAAAGTETGAAPPAATATEPEPSPEPPAEPLSPVGTEPPRRRGLLSRIIRRR